MGIDVTIWTPLKLIILLLEVYVGIWVPSTVILVSWESDIMLGIWMLKESVVSIIEDMLSFIVAVVCSDTTSEDKLKDGFMIYDGDRLPILLFELESMDLDWAFSTVSENEPCG